MLVSGIFRLGLGFLGVWFKVTLGFRQGLLEGLLEGWFRVSLGFVLTLVWGLLRVDLGFIQGRFEFI